MKKGFKRHSRWDEIMWVVGYVDYHGAVHAHIIFKGDDRDHGSLFPEAARYKTWRWCRSQGVMGSIRSKVKADKDDYRAIQDWLYKHGCLNNWELPNDEEE